jgi:hypothetical protein
MSDTKHVFDPKRKSSPIYSNSDCFTSMILANPQLITHQEYYDLDKLDHMKINSLHKPYNLLPL